MISIAFGCAGLAPSLFEHTFAHGLSVRSEIDNGTPDTETHRHLPLSTFSTSLSGVVLLKRIAFRIVGWCFVFHF